MTYLPYVFTTLNACDDELEDLSLRNRETASATQIFCTRQIIMKMSQTYKHAAAYLRSLATGEEKSL
jgi:hypothetical protein